MDKLSEISMWTISHFTEARPMTLVKKFELNKWKSINLFPFPMHYVTKQMKRNEEDEESERNMVQSEIRQQ